MARIKIENLSKEISKEDMKEIQGGYTGSIPTQLGSMTNLTGSIPVEFGNIDKAFMDGGVTSTDDWETPVA